MNIICALTLFVRTARRYVKNETSTIWLMREAGTRAKLAIIPDSVRPEKSGPWAVAKLGLK